MKNLQKIKGEKALRRKIRVRAKVSGTATTPRASVYRSNTSLYIQIIDDTTGKTLVSASSRTLKLKDKKPVEIAAEVGKAVGALALEKGVKEVVFDRNRYRYHGRVKAAADGMREAGLKF
jgi:large subunit ribosomal protein L18